MAAGGDIVVVGATQAWTDGPGSTYVYRFDGAHWIEEAKLVAADGEADAGLGASVAVRKDLILIGAYRDDAAATNAGSTYVFQFDGAAWVESGKLTAADPGAADLLGISLSISGDLALIGGPGDDDGGSRSGSAYFVRLSDCDGDTVIDVCAIVNGASDDCNNNGCPDECDVGAGAAEDCNGNQVPDECELAIPLDHNCCETDHGPGCNNPDIEACVCEQFSYCCTSDWASFCVTRVELFGCGTCDEADNDCNDNQVPDDCDVADGNTGDCNENGIPDECECDDGSECTSDSCEPGVGCVNSHVA